MQIAICDDEKSFRNDLKEVLIEYKTKKRVHIDIYEFEDGNSLLNSNVIFDVVFIDFQMPELNGLETARILRLKNCICSIIFITSYPQFVFDSFEVQPFRFFAKPLDSTKVKLAMDSYLKHQKQLNPIVIIEDGEQKTIKSEHIVYLEGDGKYCLIRTTEDIYKSSKQSPRCKNCYQNIVFTVYINHMSSTCIMFPQYQVMR